ncbi:MAG: hypothetical protein WAX12_05855 [Candidatus Microthrix subdominans]|jgi:hypothetical protein|uniref:hypothetical protein n=1 Tax=Candidatus Neomicrothrix sp. TaxID=2719034 RepID=UPI001B64F192|nr:hypothetical protein [Candidatus Microthrix sp.]MBK6440398.1 hypothetical protein [Candidatus Microthrix sp.]MBK6971226.1 hypothetical protein [Candidatus Microthrix sp.]MBK9559007.1 hypothetical protein [Candidatus Microthrix sp.]MBP7594660.1 hypothetical protein [Candidatus Microthrix sp.]MBP9065336.1 hypothetical protein [Candidatus Microthrix sp.]
MRITKPGVVSIAALVTVISLGACGGDNQASTDEVCDSLRAVATAIDESETTDPTESFDALLAALEDFAAVAPSEVGADAATLLEGAKRMSDQASGEEEANDEDPALLEDEEYERAGDRVEAYAKKTCGISIG